MRRAVAQIEAKLRFPKRGDVESSPPILRRSTGGDSPPARHNSRRVSFNLIPEEGDDEELRLRRRSSPHLRRRRRGSDVFGSATGEVFVDPTPEEKSAYAHAPPLDSSIRLHCLEVMTARSPGPSVHPLDATVECDDAL